MATKKRVADAPEAATTAKKSKVNVKSTSTSFMDIMNDMDATVDNRQAARQNKQDDGKMQVDQVLNKLLELKSLTKIEVEIRVGFISGSGFRPGLPKEDFDLFHDVLKKITPPQVTLETDYIYDGDGRISYDETNAQCLRKIKKNKLTNFDVGTNLVYDFRVSVAEESELPCPDSLPQNYISKREKLRSSFRKQFWQIDMTQVTSSGPNVQEATVYEVEFELMPASIPNHNDREIMFKILSDFFHEARTFIGKIKAPTAHSFPELILERVGNAQEVDTLRSVVMSCFPETSKGSSDAFPGSMPIGLSRRHVYTIQNNDYYVSEKTDGLRYMMLVTDDCPYLIDRKFDFWVIQGYELLVTLFGKSGCTLLDGEMIRNLGTDKPYFMIFDAMCLNGKTVTGEVLTKRLGVIGEAVNIFRAATSNPAQAGLVPFSLIGKNFYDKTTIEAVHACVKPVDGERVFKDSQGKRHHHTDGYIFTPNIPYQTYTCQFLFKWKYLDKLTVDFKLRYNKNKWCFSAVGSDGGDADCREVNFNQNDTAMVRRDIARARDQTAIIAECSFDFQRGTWRYHGMRTDKNKANYIATVFETMENVAENLTADELRYRVTLTPQNDDWEMKLQKARSDIIASRNHKNHAKGQPTPKAGPPKPAQYTPTQPHAKDNLPDQTTHQRAPNHTQPSKQSQPDVYSVSNSTNSYTPSGNTYAPPVQNNAYADATADATAGDDFDDDQTTSIDQDGAQQYNNYDDDEEEDEDDGSEAF